MSSIDNLYWIFLSTGFLVGFGHCIGMCGPIVVSMSLRMKHKAALLPHLLYNTGRIITYGVLGGIMGISGSFTIVIAHIAAIQKGVMIGTGLLIIMMGLFMSSLIPFGRVFNDYCNADNIITKGFKTLSNSGSMLTYIPLGLLLGLLPCGPVYTALISAARIGMDAHNALEGCYAGAGLMLCFGLGTIPALVLVARLVDLKWLQSREVIYKAGSVLMVGVGIFFLIKGIRY